MTKFIKEEEAKLKKQSERAVREFREIARGVSKTTTIALWINMSCAIGLFVTSFFIPPKGVIDPSVFKAGAYLFGFASLFVIREAVREGLGVKLTHGDTTIEVKDLDGDENKSVD